MSVIPHAGIPWDCRHNAKDVTLPVGTEVNKEEAKCLMIFLERMREGLDNQTNTRTVSIDNTGEISE